MAKGIKHYGGDCRIVDGNKEDLGDHILNQIGSTQPSIPPKASPSKASLHSPTTSQTTTLPVGNSDERFRVLLGEIKASLDELFAHHTPAQHPLGVPLPHLGKRVGLSPAHKKDYGSLKQILELPQASAELRIKLVQSPTGQTYIQREKETNTETEMEKKTEARAMVCPTCKESFGFVHSKEKEEDNSACLKATLDQIKRVLHEQQQRAGGGGDGKAIILLSQLAERVAMTAEASRFFKSWKGLLQHDGVLACIGATLHTNEKGKLYLAAAASESQHSNKT